MAGMVFQFLQVLIIFGIVILRWHLCRKTGLGGREGIRLINIGFWFLLVGSLVNLSDNFYQTSSLEFLGSRFVRGGAGHICNILGFILMLFGFLKALPMLEASRQEAKLRQSILDAIPAPVFFKDEKGIYLEGNQTFAEFIGLPLEKIIGKTVFGVAPKDLANIYHQADMDLIQRGGKQLYETKVRFSDGSYHDVMFHKAVFEKDDGSPGGIVGAMLDITERKAAEEALREFDRMKNEFISTAAHELRTPLTTVMGYTELLRNLDEFGPFDSEQQQKFLSEIYQRCEFLAKIIDDLLDISRIEQGAPIRLHLAPCFPFEILQKVVDRYRKQVDTHQFEAKLPEPKSLTAILDQDRIIQVLDNLLSNAVKYSPAGGVITVLAKEERGRLLVIVRDEGIGMTEEETAHVFDKFYRADGSSTAVGGLGLGMSIAKHIVEEHGGVIEISSTPGHGTEVVFTLGLDLKNSQNALDEKNPAISS